MTTTNTASETAALNANNTTTETTTMTTTETKPASNLAATVTECLSITAQKKADREARKADRLAAKAAEEAAKANRPEIMTKKDNSGLATKQFFNSVMASPEGVILEVTLRDGTTYLGQVQSVTTQRGCIGNTTFHMTTLSGETVSAAWRDENLVSARRVALSELSALIATQAAADIKRAENARKSAARKAAKAATTEG